MIVFPTDDARRVKFCYRVVGNYLYVPKLWKNSGKLQVIPTKYLESWIWWILSWSNGQDEMTVQCGNGRDMSCQKKCFTLVWSHVMNRAKGWPRRCTWVMWNEAECVITSIYSSYTHNGCLKFCENMYSIEIKVSKTGNLAVVWPPVLTCDLDRHGSDLWYVLTLRRQLAGYNRWLERVSATHFGECVSEVTGGHHSELWRWGGSAVVL